MRLNYDILFLRMSSLMSKTKSLLQLEYCCRYTTPHFAQHALIHSLINMLPRIGKSDHSFVRFSTARNYTTLALKEGRTALWPKSTYNQPPSLLSSFSPVSEMTHKPATEGEKTVAKGDNRPTEGKVDRENDDSLTHSVAVLRHTTLSRSATMMMTTTPAPILRNCQEYPGTRKLGESLGEERIFAIYRFYFRKLKQ